MSSLYEDEITSTTAGTIVCGPPWPLSASDSDVSDEGSILSAYGESEYLPAGEMTGDFGNVLRVYLDRWGGAGANYILAPDLVEYWPESWGLETITFRRDNTETQCLTSCGGSDLPGDGDIPNVQTPEPGTVWLVSASLILVLMWRAVFRRRVRF